MIKSFPIEYISYILQQTFYEEKNKNPNYYGGAREIAIYPLYSQLESQEQVDRFVDNFMGIVKQQNRANLIGAGILLSPENPTITNLYSSTIIPMSWNCAMRCNLENKDKMVETINNAIDVLKGRKVDIAQLKLCDENGRFIGYQPFCVGTIGEEIYALNNKVYIQNGAFLGFVGVQTATILQIRTRISTILADLASKGVDTTLRENMWLYAEKGGHIIVIAYERPAENEDPNWYIVENDGNHDDILFVPDHLSFEKYKVSLSFDLIRCDIPRTLNGQEVCDITFGGSATLVNYGVALGNDIIRVSFTKKMIKAQTDIVFESASKTWLEPLEMPSGNNANTNINQLLSNKMISNTHTDALGINLQYTFICDKSIPLLKQWFNYGRYGTQGINVTDISPNMIYEVEEVICEWGDFESNKVNAKITESIDIENTESDTLTLGINLQVQGANV